MCIAAAAAAVALVSVKASKRDGSAVASAASAKEDPIKAIVSKVGNDANVTEACKGVGSGDHNSPCCICSFC